MFSEEGTKGTQQRMIHLGSEPFLKRTPQWTVCLVPTITISIPTIRLIKTPIIPMSIPTTPTLPTIPMF